LVLYRQPRGYCEGEDLRAGEPRFGERGGIFYIESGRVGDTLGQEILLERAFFRDINLVAGFPLGELEVEPGQPGAPLGQDWAW
jgi:hypothetical protein